MCAQILLCVLTVVPLDAQAVLVWASARVESQCRVTGGLLDFSDYNPIGVNATRPQDTEGTFEVQCTPGSRVRIALEAGLHATGQNRKMAMIGGLDSLSYDLYQDSGRSRAWNGTDVRTFDGFGASPLRVRVYGRIPQGQNVRAGDYEDSVLIVVRF
jgi:spore coat protein U-like protein